MTWHPPLNEGRGKAVGLVLVVMFYPGLTRRLEDGWGRGGGASRRASGQPKCGNGPGPRMPFMEEARDFPWWAVMPKAVLLFVPRAGRAAGRVRWMYI